MEDKTAEIQLFDLSGNDHPFHVDFRITRVYHCYICRALTNLAIHNTGRFGGRAHAICRNEQVKWHKKLEEMIRWLELHPHPASYRKELADEISLYRHRHEHEIKDDIVGKEMNSVAATDWIHKPVKFG